MHEIQNRRQAFHGDEVFQRSIGPFPIPLIGRRLDDAVEFALALGPAGEIIRLAAETGELLKRQVVAALRDSLSAYQRSDGIWAGSSTWFVAARNPGR